MVCSVQERKFLGRTERFDIKLPLKEIILFVDTFFVRYEN